MKMMAGLSQGKGVEGEAAAKTEEGTGPSRVVLCCSHEFGCSRGQGTKKQSYVLCCSRGGCWCHYCWLGCGVCGSLIQLLSLTQ